MSDPAAASSSSASAAPAAEPTEATAVPAAAPSTGPASYVVITSSDDHEFIVKRKRTQISGTINEMLSGPAGTNEDEMGKVFLPSIPSRIAQRICHFFNYRAYWAENYKEGDDIPDFEFDPRIALEVYTAAHFLNA